MTVKEVARVWKVSESTVRRYCSKQYVPAHTENGRWIIPDNYPQPFLSRKKKFKSDVERSDFVLTVIGSGKYIDYKLLPLTEDKFIFFAEQLKADNLVTQNGTAYCLTLAGIDRLRKIQREHRDEVRANITTAVNVAGAFAQVVSVAVTALPMIM